MNDALASEWTTLQTQQEAYERSGLMIKLLAVALVAAGSWLPLAAPVGVVCVLVWVLWAQEAIMKTWQSRLSARLMRIEAALGGSAPGETPAYQLHTQWQVQRPDAVGLLLAYV